MAIREPSFTLGIEEEYLLVDEDSRDLAQDPPPALLAKCQEALLDYGGQVSRSSCARRSRSAPASATPCRKRATSCGSCARRSAP